MKEVYMLSYSGDPEEEQDSCFEIFSSKESAYRSTAAALRKGFRDEQSQEMKDSFQREDYEGYVNAWNRLQLFQAEYNRVVNIRKFNVDSNIVLNASSFGEDSDEDM
jgi:uncharacterized protein (DUF2225 family)